MANTEGGYWVLGVEPEAAKHVEVGSVPLETPAAGLLMSDGFYRLVDTFGLVAEDRLLGRAREEGLSALLAEVRQAEDNDPDCLRHPRFKPKDDATALLLEMTPPR